jgi:hypothetical protein
MAEKKKEAKRKNQGYFADSQVINQINMIKALKNMDPGLEKAYQAYIIDDVGGFNSAIEASDFFKNNLESARTRQTAKVRQNGAYLQDLENFTSQVKTALGDITWTKDVADQVEYSFLAGSNIYDTKANIVEADAIGKIDLGSLGGTSLGDVTSLQSYASEYWVDGLLSTSYWDTKQKALFAGDITVEGIQKEIRDLSVSYYPAYADQIKANSSMDANGSDALMGVANWLEVDKNVARTKYGSLIDKITQYIDPATGKPGIMPGWMKEKIIKSDPNWGKTKNGTESVNKLMNIVSTNFFGGVV